jgi:hypothetical protein
MTLQLRHLVEAAAAAAAVQMVTAAAVPSRAEAAGTLQVGSIPTAGEANQGITSKGDSRCRWWQQQQWRQQLQARLQVAAFPLQVGHRLDGSSSSGGGGGNGSSSSSSSDDCNSPQHNRVGAGVAMVESSCTAHVTCNDHRLHCCALQSAPTYAAVCLLHGMPLQKDVIPPRVAREAANAEELRLMINAAYIAGLPPCQVSS